MIGVLAESKIAAALLVALVSLGACTPFLIITLVGSSTNLASLPGVPVTQTIFASLVSDEPDSAMLPAGDFVEIENSFVMRFNYSDLPRIGSAEAAEAAHNFIAKVPYLAIENLTLVPEYTDNTGFEQSLWRLQFVGDRMVVHISVNVFSGKVMSFSPRWQHSCPFNGSSEEERHLPKKILEQKTVQFLRDHNYTLSANARYFGPVLSDYYGRLVGPSFNYNVTALFFFNTVERAVIWHNIGYMGPYDDLGPLALALDSETGAVLDFKYRYWIHVSNLPEHDMITPGFAEQVALDHMFEERNTSSQVLTTALVFEGIRSSEFKLCWVVYLDGSHSIASVHVDAFNADIVAVLGEITAHDDTQVPWPKMDTVPVTYALGAFVISLIAATASYSMVKRRLVLQSSR